MQSLYQDITSKVMHLYVIVILKTSVHQIRTA